MNTQKYDTRIQINQLEVFWNKLIVSMKQVDCIIWKKNVWCIAKKKLNFSSKNYEQLLESDFMQS